MVFYNIFVHLGAARARVSQNHESILVIRYVEQ